MPGKNKYPTVRLSSEVCDRLARVNGKVASMGLSRYFFLLDSVTLDFTELELDFLGSFCDEEWTFLNPLPLKGMTQAIAMQVADQRESATKWGVSVDFLIAQINALDLLSVFALIEAIEQRRMRYETRFGEESIFGSEMNE
jgi:hypothetical protein